MQAIISSVIRHLLTVAAGALLSIGVTKSQADDLVKTVEPIGTGIVLYGISQAWSIKDKKANKKVSEE